MSQSTNQTTQKKTYECFECKRLGVKGVQVVLGGRDQHGKTIYLEPNGRTAHQHQHVGKQEAAAAAAPVQQQQQQGSTIIITRQEWDQVKLDIKEIKQILQRNQSIYGDLIQFMHNSTIIAQQQRDKDQQLAEEEVRYDQDKEDGLV